MCPSNCNYVGNHLHTVPFVCLFCLQCRLSGLANNPMRHESTAGILLWQQRGECLFLCVSARTSVSASPDPATKTSQEKTSIFNSHRLYPRVQELWFSSLELWHRGTGLRLCLSDFSACFHRFQHIVVSSLYIIMPNGRTGSLNKCQR